MLKGVRRRRGGERESRKAKARESRKAKSRKT